MNIIANLLNTKIVFKKGKDKQVYYITEINDCGEIAISNFSPSIRETLDEDELYEKEEASAWHSEKEFKIIYNEKV